VFESGIMFRWHCMLHTVGPYYLDLANNVLNIESLAVTLNMTNIKHGLTLKRSCPITAYICVATSTKEVQRRLHIGCLVGP